MYLNVSQTLAHLPPEYNPELFPIIRTEFIQSNKTIVVLDDDPTGTQTCYDTVVLISWSTEEIEEELLKQPAILFILTNSRSLKEEDAVELNLEIGNHLKAAAQNTKREIVVISRSDSTLRGHFPAEVDAIAHALDMDESIRVLIPAFIEGKRYTLDDTHYIVEQDELVPVSETPFARDTAFGYSHSNLKEWVKEKTKGKIDVSDILSISINDLRLGGPDVVLNKLLQCTEKNLVIVNAASYTDLMVFALASIRAENQGKHFIFRSSATFVPLRAGLESGKAYLPTGQEIKPSAGRLIIVGSHVPKTTAQLNWLLAQNQSEVLEINVPEILKSDQAGVSAMSISKQTDQWLIEGKQVILYTSRTLATGSDPEDSLRINAAVSEFLVTIVKQLTIRPGFILAKGGITSSDLAAKALGSKKANVLGPILPGVPLWQLDSHCKFPHLIYIVFPGNVGGEKALGEVLDKLKN